MRHETGQFGSIEPVISTVAPKNAISASPNAAAPIDQRFPRNRKFADSPLERTGFELLVPRYSELSWREVSLDIRRGRRAHRLSGPLSAGRTARRRCQRSEWRRSTHRVILAHLHDVAERERSSGQANQVIRVSTQPDAQRQRSGVPARKWDRESSNPACSSGIAALPLPLERVSPKTQFARLAAGESWIRTFGSGRERVRFCP